MTTLPRWRKSGYSGPNDHCVEVSRTLDQVRDSKNPTGPTLRFNAATFAAFVHAVKAGRFDH
jgi:hypothetical protein